MTRPGDPVVLVNPTRRRPRPRDGDPLRAALRRRRAGRRLRRRAATGRPAGERWLPLAPGVPEELSPVTAAPAAGAGRLPPRRAGRQAVVQLPERRGPRPSTTTRSTARRSETRHERPAHWPTSSPRPGGSSSRRRPDLPVRAARWRRASPLHDHRAGAGEPRARTYGDIDVVVPAKSTPRDRRRVLTALGLRAQRAVQRAARRPADAVLRHRERAPARRLRRRLLDVPPSSTSPAARPAPLRRSTRPTCC